VATTRKHRRDDEVLAAAVRVFHRSGYSDATVQNIADEVGILKGSLYHYIDTKEDLLFRLFETIHEDARSILAEVSAEGGAALTRLERYIRRQVAYNIDNLERITVYYHDIDKLTGPRLQQVLEQRREHSRFVAALIADAQRDGSATYHQDPELLCNCVFSTISWTYRWYRPGRGLSKERVIDECTRYAIRGVAGARSHR
jgi:AcrR family transcriptional regulator